MSSEKNSNANRDLVLALAAIIGFTFIKYEFEILTSLVVFGAVVSGVGVLAGYVYGMHYFWTRPPRRKDELTTDIDLSFLENPRWDAEPMYERDRYTGQWVECSESEIQASPAPQEIPEQEVPKRKVVIDSNKLLKTPLHAELGLCPEEIEYLKKWNYQRKEFVPLGEIRRQPFWIKECKPESLEHTFVVHSIAKKLPEWADVRTYFTQLPDVVFTYNNKEYALEIETPLFIKKKHKRLVAKASVNNQTYADRWWIVTTQSAYRNSFKRYGKVLTRNQIDEWIQSIFPE